MNTATSTVTEHEAARGSFKKQERNPGVTELAEIPGRGPALVIDTGWRGMAQSALACVQRFVK